MNSVSVSTLLDRLLQPVYERTLLAEVKVSVSTLLDRLLQLPLDVGELCAVFGFSIHTVGSFAAMVLHGLEVEMKLMFQYPICWIVWLSRPAALTRPQSFRHFSIHSVGSLN